MRVESCIFPRGQKVIFGNSSDGQDSAEGEPHEGSCSRNCLVDPSIPSSAFKPLLKSPQNLGRQYLSLGQAERVRERKDGALLAVFCLNGQVVGLTFPLRRPLLGEGCCWEEKRAQVQQVSATSI